MIADGVIRAVDTTGSLTVIRNSGLEGYATAAWPRYWHESFGSGLQPVRTCLRPRCLALAVIPPC